ncbi:MFS transporter [Demequina sp. SYSU T00192]|uniref:MFS transporter n=1 Tax=Demequina litoralis TaxID=3051660 RepID=A0ABT8G5N8_9MICO|nr:MFS transporter [Demequina sp. SYSU T00192]MDN4474450.1 MFS transporter [Demequina sp. SYSU T00192]
MTSLDTLPEPSGAAPAGSGTKPAMPEFKWRLAIALFLGGILWIAPYVGSIAVLMPALVEDIAPDQKVALVGVLGIAGAALSLVSNIIFGALSDVTRSRYGARVPWIVGGAAVAAASLFMFGGSGSVPELVIWWCVYMTALNAIIAPMVAEISDRVPTERRGTVSAIYGVGMLIGATASTVVGAFFVSNPGTGISMFAFLTILSAVVFVAIAPRTSNLGVAREKLSGKQIVRSFRPPTKGARDFYLALFGKFFLVAGTYAVSNYQLYILTDYIKLEEDGAAKIIAINGMIALVTGLVFGFISGPISDKFGRRKPFVIVSALVVAIGMAFPLAMPAAWAMVAYAVFLGVGQGTFNSVDQALNIDVLPDADSAAKDLGILNVANSGGQILGPVIMSIVVTVTGGYALGFGAAILLLIAAAVTLGAIKTVK